jgi:diadenylate cyclase
VTKYVIDRLEQLWYRLSGYMQDEPWTMVIELATIWLLVYVIATFLRDTRGGRALKGAALVFIVATLFIRIIVREDTFERLNYIYSGLVGFAALALVILFQPEIRRALVRLGETRWFGQAGLRKAVLIEEVLAAVKYLSKNKIGALIALERETGLRHITEGGTRLDAEVSRQLLNTLFWPGSALHDMGVVIHGDRIIAAGVQFPLAEGGHFSDELGSRHRAAIGLSQEADCLIIVVSEETGTISLAERGNLTRKLDIEGLRSHLTRGMGRIEIDENASPDASSSSSSSSSSTTLKK